MLSCATSAPKGCARSMCTDPAEHNVEVVSSISFDAPGMPVKLSTLPEGDNESSLVEWLQRDVCESLSRLEKKFDAILDRTDAHGWSSQVLDRSRVLVYPSLKRSSTVDVVAAGPLVRPSVKRSSTDDVVAAGPLNPLKVNLDFAPEASHSAGGSHSAGREWQQSATTSFSENPSHSHPVGRIGNRVSVMVDSEEILNFPAPGSGSRIGRSSLASRRMSTASRRSSRRASKHSAMHSVDASSKTASLSSAFMGITQLNEALRNMDRIRQTVLTHRNEKERSAWSTRIWRFTEKPFSSTGAYIYAIIVPMFVAIGVGLSFVQTVDGSALEGTAGELVQAIFESAFALELIVRFIVCPDRRNFMCNMFNYIDLMSASPLVLRITGYVLHLTDSGELSDGVLRIVTVVPLLRLLRLTRRFETFHLLLSAFKVAIEALPVLLYILLLIALIFAALIYFVEPETNIDSLPTALWLTIVTMTTVGYGDITPQSVAGHIVVSILIIISALYMAIPIGIVGTAFSQVWGDRDRLLLIQRMRDAFLEGGYTADAVENIFRLFDADNSGELDIDEFTLMLRTMQINIGEERVLALFQAIDHEGEGQITQQDLLDSMFPRSFVVSLLSERPSRKAVSQGSRPTATSRPTIPTTLSPEKPADRSIEFNSESLSNSHDSDT